MNNGKLSGVAFIDLRTAFDTVNHCILLNKLKAIGASDVALKWFRSYLTGRTQRVHFKKSLSNPLEVNAGVPQGSILGPLLFIVFINSLSNVIQHGKVFMYADDTTLSVCGNDVNDISKKLEDDLSLLGNWLNDNKTVSKY